MTEYQFELLFALKPDEQAEQYIDALFEAGCDDATPSIGEKGSIALTFTRESSDALSAITSAIKNVKSAVPHAELKSAGPYLLNLTELAFEFGYTKQYLQKVARNDTSFPAPFIGGKTSYWKIDEVAQWLVQHNNDKLTKSEIETFRVIRALNLWLEKQKIDSYSDIEFRIDEVA